MKLADLRRTAIKSNIRIRFSIRDGLECVVNEHGLAQVPALRNVPTFNLEEELARAPQFTLERIASGEKKGAERTQVLSREQLAAMVDVKSADAPHDDHDD